MYRYILCSSNHIYIGVIDGAAAWAEIMSEEEYDNKGYDKDDLIEVKKLNLVVRTWPTVEKLMKFMEIHNPMVPPDFKFRKVLVKDPKQKYITLSDALDAIYWKGDAN